MDPEGPEVLPGGGSPPGPVPPGPVEGPEVPEKGGPGGTFPELGSPLPLMMVRKFQFLVFPGS